MKNPNVTILGATGAVGREMLKILEERNFPIGELRCRAVWATLRAACPAPSATARWRAVW